MATVEMADTEGIEGKLAPNILKTEGGCCLVQVNTLGSRHNLGFGLVFWDLHLYFKEKGNQEEENKTGVNTGRGKGG